ncbi:hypothetical protein ARSEF4850_002920 [Beauveria asiatica]
MTSTIIADIEARDGEALSLQRRSLSLSLLAMCLLNGEILDNNDRDR